VTTTTYERDHLWLDHDGLDGLIDALQSAGYRVIGPQVHGASLIYGELDGAGDLPSGWTDQQAPGCYRLRRRDDHARFGYAVPQHAWKRTLLPPTAPVWRAERVDGHIRFVEADHRADPVALLGVRPCELHAIARQDRVLLEGRTVEPSYAARRASAFVIAVNCSDPSGSCFCTSMGTGPRAATDAGADLVLTEVLDGGVPSYLVEVGTQRGRELMEFVRCRPASVVEVRAAERVTDSAAARITRHLDATETHDALLASYEDPAWARIGDRCLACASCTLVCPTCFCTTVHDSTDLTATVTERWRVWDSCFSVDFSHLAPGPVRPSNAGRYRHWINHKLATWVDQFGEAGCVGCGRCITWCPVGIDMMAEAQARVMAVRERAAFTEDEAEVLA
jgi:Fe-S-cluster-containing hydrogenase component 2